MKKLMITIGVALVAIGANAAAFTGELYWAYWDNYAECDIWHEDAGSVDWRDGFVDVNGSREPAAWSVDQFVYPVSIEPGETFSAEVVHITSTPAHIKSVNVYSDLEMLNLYKGGDDDNYYVQKFWPKNSTQETRAWIVVSLDTVKSGDVYAFDLATSPIINDPDYPKFYNPADGDGEPSSIWTLTSFARAFGVSLTGTREVTKSVSFDVKIGETGETFGQRVWNVCCPFVVNGNDWDDLDKVDDNGGDEEIMVAVGLYFVTDEMVNGGGSGGDEVVPDPVTPGYDAIDEKDIVAHYDVPKAIVLQGAAYDGNGAVVGIVELKLGKVSKGSGKVSGSFVGLDGKKQTIKAPKLTGIDGASPVTVALDVKGLGTMNVTIGGELFAGSLGRYHVQTADVGGNWSKSGAKVYMDAASASLPAGTLEGFLPVGEPVVAAGGKWEFEKAASVKWAKPKKGAAQPEIYDDASGKGLVVDTTKGKNLSGLKLTYTPKKGTFKGSFNVYALEGAGSATKLKKYKLSVSGVVVNGTGYGTAVCKNPALNWTVTVR